MATHQVRQMETNSRTPVLVSQKSTSEKVCVLRIIPFLVLEMKRVLLELDKNPALCALNWVTPYPSGGTETSQPQNWEQGCPREEKEVIYFLRRAKLCTQTEWFRRDGGVAARSRKTRAGLEFLLKGSSEFLPGRSLSRASSSMSSDTLQDTIDIGRGM